MAPTEIAVGYVNQFSLLPLEFIIWSLRGLLAGELHGFTVILMVVLN